MAFSMLLLDAAGFKLVFSLHDEAVAELHGSDSEMEEQFRRASEIMSTVPDWMEGMPVAVDGGILRRYGKA